MKQIKSFISKHKSQLILFALITLICAFIFVPYWISGNTFMLGWDMRTEYSSNFYNLRLMLKEAISEHKLPFYCWNTFLGNNYWSTKLFYYQDTFDYIFALGTDLDYYTVVQIQTYLKFLIAGFGFYTYAKYHHYSSRTCVLSGLLFAFSAYGMQTQMHPFFSSFFVFLPYYFLSVDKYLQEKKKYGFIFWVFFLLFTNYYMFYSVSIFTILYFLYQYQKLHGTLKHFMKQALPLIGCYLVGALICGVVLIPEAMYVLTNERVGQSSTVFTYQSLLPYINFLIGVITPTSTLANRTSSLGTLYSYVSSNNSVMAVFLWCGSIMAIAFPQFMSKKNHDWKANRISILAVTLFTLVPFLCSFMHGFSEPSFRWLQGPIVLLLVMGLPYLEDLQYFDPKLLKRSILPEAVILLGAPLLMAAVTGKAFSDLWPDYAVLIIAALFLILIWFLTLQKRTKAVAVVTVAELCFVAYESFYATPYFVGQDSTYVDDVEHSLGGTDDFNEYMQTLDGNNSTQFYRTYVDTSTVFWDYSINLNLNHNMMGFSAYDSTYSSSMDDMKQLGDITAYLNWTFDIKDSNIINLCSGKYAVVQDESGLPEGGHYTYLSDFHGYEIYQNDDYVNLGKTYSKVISYSEYQGDTDVLNDTVIAKDEDLEEIKGLLGSDTVSFAWVRRSMNELDATIETTEDGFTVLSIPYDEGWTVTDNGETVKTYRVSGGLTGIALSSGKNEIHMQYVPKGFKYGEYATVAGVVLLAGMIILDLRRRKKIQSN